MNKIMDTPATTGGGSDNGPIITQHAAVRRNPSIKKLLKLPMWGSGTIKCFPQNNTHNKYVLVIFIQYLISNNILIY